MKVKSANINIIFLTIFSLEGDNYGSRIFVEERKNLKNSFSPHPLNAPSLMKGCGSDASHVFPYNSSNFRDCLYPFILLGG